MGTRGTIGKLLVGLSLLLARGLPAGAQAQVGDDVLLNLNGNLGTGYSASYGTGFPSGHGFTYGGNADLSGSYYDPKFLSFHLNPYVNQSRENSNFQSITTTSGLNAGANIFSGSHFPGWVNFNENYNGTGNFAVPGLPNYVTHGNSRSFGIGWSELIPAKPAITASYQQGSSEYSVFGTNNTSDVHYRNFATTISHNIDGFQLNGNFHYTKNHSTFPQLFASEPPQKFDTDTNSFGAGVSHKLLWNGSASAHYNQSDYGYQGSFARNSGSVRSVDGFASLNPTSKLSIDANTYYTDNLLGTLYQTIASAGGGVFITPGSSTSSFSVASTGVYTVNESLRLIGRADHRQQTFAGGSYGGNSYGGVVTYFHFLWGGRFNATQTVSENLQSYNHQSSLGFNSSAGYSRSIGRWNAAGTLSYYQNQQTILVTYSSSGYSYNVTLGRRLGWKAYANLSAGGSHSFYDNQSQGGYSSESYTASLTCKYIGASASYGKSNGTGILTAGGVVPTPLPNPIPLTPLLLFAGESYSYSLGGSPVRNLTFTANYTHIHGLTFEQTSTSKNFSELASAYLQYRFRKLYLYAGYSRIQQGFSESGVLPATANSYYAGISRWFHFF